MSHWSMGLALELCRENDVVQRTAMRQYVGCIGAIPFIEPSHPLVHKVGKSDSQRTIWSSLTTHFNSISFESRLLRYTKSVARIFYRLSNSE